MGIGTPIVINLIRKSSGFASAQLIGLLILAGLPIFLMANENKSSVLNRQNIEERRRHQSADFAESSFYALNSQTVCTKNFENSILIGKNISAIQGHKFLPHLMDNSGNLVSHDIFSENSLGQILTDIQVNKSELSFVAKRSNNTSLAVWRIYFAGKKIGNSTETLAMSRIQQIPMFIETDESNRITGCRLTKYELDYYLEDKICSTLNGPGYKFEMKNTQCLH